MSNYGQVTSHSLDPNCLINVGFDRRMNWVEEARVNDEALREMSRGPDKCRVKIMR